jgi:hypothetical protein
VSVIIKRRIERKKMRNYCDNNNLNEENLFLTRRGFLNKFGMGMGALGLMQLLQTESLAGSLSVKEPHFPVKAKRVIHIFFGGGQSHLDTWDPKPLLNKIDGEKLPNMNGLACGSPFKFNKYGKSGIEVSDAFAKTAEHIDSAAVIRSMVTDVPAHEVATLIMNTGNFRFIRPSLGSWISYGLGSINQNLPAFISLRPGGNGDAKNWGASFLPGIYQGTSINTSLNSVSQMIQNINNQNLTLEEQKKQLELLNKINQAHNKKLNNEAALDSRIESFELAFKMQTEATDVFDITKEPQNVREMYGMTTQGKQMLVARRLVEKGVRFVQVWTGGWDNHNEISRSLKGAADQVDGPIAALIQDLKNKGMLDSTLIILSGEFGRTPSRDGTGGQYGFGRSHWSRAFSSVLIGGGVKGGTVYGETDEIGGNVIKDRMHVHDLHATVLHLMGFDHTKLTYRYSGRDFRLTDVHGEVAKNIIA